MNKMYWFTDAELDEEIAIYEEALEAMTDILSFNTADEIDAAEEYLSKLHEERARRTGIDW